MKEKTIHSKYTISIHDIVENTKHTAADIYNSCLRKQLYQLSNFLKYEDGQIKVTSVIEKATPLNVEFIATGRGVKIIASDFLGTQAIHFKEANKKPESDIVSNQITVLSKQDIIKEIDAILNIIKIIDDIKPMYNEMRKKAARPVGMVWFTYKQNHITAEEKGWLHTIVQVFQCTIKMYQFTVVNTIKSCKIATGLTEQMAAQYV